MKLETIIENQAEVDGQFAIAYALLCIANQLKWLGNGDASTHMGAIEGLGAAVIEGLKELKGGYEA